MSILQGYLEDYWMASFEGSDDPDADGRKDAMTLADNAVEVFQALFANSLDFYDKATIEAFLRQMREPADEVMLKKMVRWPNDLILESGAVGRLIYKSAETATDLGEKIEPFSKMGAAEDLLTNKDVPKKADPQDFLATDKESREHQELARI
ncbi:MAG: hypothetical protein Q9184_003628 [Pyrenodesmia sp. 2 TL-2023]